MRGKEKGAHPEFRPSSTSRQRQCGVLVLVAPGLGGDATRHRQSYFNCRHEQNGAIAYAHITVTLMSKTAECCLSCCCDQFRDYKDKYIVYMYTEMKAYNVFYTGQRSDVCYALAAAAAAASACQILRLLPDTNKGYL